MFHVPDGSRVGLAESPEWGSTTADGNNGAFRIESPEPGWRLLVIASDASIPGLEPWDHVSVHAYRREQSRTPTWKEMNYVKDLFWDPDDVVMQLHPRKRDYVNTHPHTLHLWRPRHTPIPTPPTDYV